MTSARLACTTADVAVQRLPVLRLVHQAHEQVEVDGWPPWASSSSWPSDAQWATMTRTFKRPAVGAGAAGQVARCSPKPMTACSSPACVISGSSRPPTVSGRCADWPGRCFARQQPLQGLAPRATAIQAVQRARVVRMHRATHSKCCGCFAASAPILLVTGGRWTPRSGAPCFVARAQSAASKVLKPAGMPSHCASRWSMKLRVDAPGAVVRCGGVDVDLAPHVLSQVPRPAHARVEPQAAARVAVADDVRISVSRTLARVQALPGGARRGSSRSDAGSARHWLSRPSRSAQVENCPGQPAQLRRVTRAPQTRERRGRVLARVIGPDAVFRCAA